MNKNFQVGEFDSHNQLTLRNMDRRNTGNEEFMHMFKTSTGKNKINKIIQISFP